MLTALWRPLEVRFIETLPARTISESELRWYMLL